MTRAQFASYKFSNWIFSLLLLPLLLLFGLVCSFVSISIRFRITGGRVRLVICACVYMCMSGRARARVERPLFTIWWKKNVYCRYWCFRVESNSPYSCLTHSHCNQTGTQWMESLLRLCIFFVLYIFSTFCHSLLLSTVFHRASSSHRAEIGLFGRLLTWSFKTKWGPWTLYHWW